MAANTLHRPTHRHVRLQRLIALLALLALLPMPARAQTEGQYQRIYLATNPGHFLYWTFNPLEADANAPTMNAECGGVGLSRGTQCYSGTVNGEPMLQFSFNPMSRALGTVSWGPAAPLRFRLALTVEGATPTSVKMVAFTSHDLLESAPAAEVAPGIWEGEMTQAGTLGPTQLVQFSLRVTFPSTAPVQVAKTITLQTAGESWLELPHAVAGRSLADMRRASPAPTQPTSFRTDLRTFTFNDGDWEAFSFEGDLSERRDFSVPLARRAAGVMGVVEMFREPAIYEAIRNGEISTERLTEAPITELVRNGVPIAAGANSRTENAGRGSDTVAAVDVGAGNLVLRVDGNQFKTDSSAAGGDNSYRAYVVVMYGERTLDSYQASYMPRHSVQTPPAKTVAAGTCQHHSEMLPVPASVTAVSADITWDAVTPTHAWTHNYSSGYGSYPCGEAGTGTEITTVMTPKARVLAYGVTLSRHTTQASQRDVVIDERIDLVHNP
jgi:hypothetical protein